MRITFVLTIGLDIPSGRRYFALAKELVRLGHEVTILALHPSLRECHQREMELEGVRIYYLGQMHIRRYAGEVERFGPAKLFRILCASTGALAYRIARTEADVFHLGKPHPVNAVAAVLGGRLWKGVRLYLDCDDYEAQANAFGAEWQRSVFAFFEDVTPRFVRGITVNTPYLRERNVALGFPVHRIVYVPNGVDRDRIAALQDQDAQRLRHELGLDRTKLVAYAGHMGLVNHPVDLLLEAFAHVSRECGEVRLLLVGSGEDLELLRGQATQLGLDDRVIFIGYVPHDLALRYLKMADLSVDPVRDDPVARARSPLKIFESLAVGTPVVTGDVGDRRNILGDGTAGLLVDPGDSQALAEGIMELLRDDDRRRVMSEAALEVRNRYYWDVLVREFVKVYDVA
jgi:glycosyltransferase involved in cell wall biosynthesis